MQGLGNDYIYLDCMHRHIRDAAALAIRMSDRHYGVGGDGLICLCPSDCADFRMEIYNPDGSRAEMCGNGIRCAGKYAYEAGIVRQTAFCVETGAGIRRLRLHLERGSVALVTVDMGVPVVEQEREFEIGGRTYRVTPVSMGNPHAVTRVDDPDSTDVAGLGPALERHPTFPRRTNVEFVSVMDREHLRMRVWERGAGETLACGTGACAALAACVRRGLCGRSADVQLPGGTLRLCWREDGGMDMTGPAETVFQGQWPETADAF